MTTVLSSTFVGQRFLKALANSGPPPATPEVARDLAANAFMVAVDDHLFGIDQAESVDLDAVAHSWAERIEGGRDFSDWWSLPARGRLLKGRAEERQRALPESSSWETGPDDANWFLASGGALEPVWDAQTAKFPAWKELPADLPLSSFLDPKRVVVIRRAHDWLDLVDRFPTSVDIGAKAHWGDWARYWAISAGEELLLPSWEDARADGVAGVCLTVGAVAHLEGTAPRRGGRVSPITGWIPGATIVLG